CAGPRCGVRRQVVSAIGWPMRWQRRLPWSLPRGSRRSARRPPSECGLAPRRRRRRAAAPALPCPVHRRVAGEGHPPWLGMTPAPAEPAPVALGRVRPPARLAPRDRLAVPLLPGQPRPPLPPGVGAARLLLRGGPRAPCPVRQPVVLPQRPPRVARLPAVAGHRLLLVPVLSAGRIPPLRLGPTPL